MTTQTKPPKSKIKKAKKPAGITVTLCMIVKDETHIIKDCLTSMIPYIDRYDITDTGSTDGTPEMIEEFFEEHGVPGEVYRSDWKGFGDTPNGIGSRTESLQNADSGGANYAWIIDADDFVDEVEGKFIYPDVMDKDAYSLQIKRGDFVWWRNQLFKLGIGWHYEGFLHEYAACDNPQHSGARIGGQYSINARTLGARNVGITPKEKYTKDANELNDALTNSESPYYDPENARYHFYLAQSYFDSQQYEKSFEAYEKRILLGGWEEEVYYSLFRLGIISSILEKPWLEIQQRYLQAWNYRPCRAEPLHAIARCYRGQNQPRLANLFAKQAVDIPYPQQDILFLSQDVYTWQSLDEFVATAYYVNDFYNGYNAAKHLLEKCPIPDSERPRILENFKAYEAKVKEIEAQKQEHEQAQNELNRIVPPKKEKKPVNTNKKGTKSNQKKRGKPRKKKK